MCGIFGVINFDGQPVDKEKVLSARDILAHRGPDDSGIYLSSHGVVTRRSRINQPISQSYSSPCSSPFINNRSLPRRTPADGFG